jgi:Ppx/GppA phosphatase family protein
VDIGSNSLHLVIVEADPGSFRIIGREKEMVRLGEGLAEARLSTAAMDRALETLGRYCRLAMSHRVDKIVGVATSAVREAANCELELWGGERGKDLLERVLGMPVTLQRAPVVASGTALAASTI